MEQNENQDSIRERIRAYAFDLKLPLVRTLKSVNVANNLLSESSGFSCSDNAVLTDWNVSNNNLKYDTLNFSTFIRSFLGCKNTPFKSVLWYAKH